MAAAIQPARLISRRAHLVPGKLHVTELFFEVPKNYANPEAGTLKLFGRSVTKYDRPIVPPSPSEAAKSERRPYLVYLEGGPGFGNREPQESALTRYALERGYQLLFLDYRGTGLSTPLNAEALAREGGPQAQADYLKLFRADTIVRDSEAVRMCLTADFPEEKKKWSIFGQSFGGFVSLTYLSKYPQGLREVFLTGGLAPVRRVAEDVYRATYRKVVERNQAYYNKFPEDVETVHELVKHISSCGGLPLPAGGKLTVDRLLSLGLSFGSHGGLDGVHAVILKLAADLDQFGFFTRAALVGFEQQLPLDTNPIYAILHEAIYCYKKGISSSWAAYRVGKEIHEFSWLGGKLSFSGMMSAKAPLYFSGEMIYPSYFDSYPQLVWMKEAANILADYDGWDDLYDEQQLLRNEVPVYAASFVDDMYVDFELARETANLVKGIKVFETNSMYHNAVRARSEEVIGQLFRMRDDTID
ncbi:Alpha/Beta hydrolase protein [Podospora didyma]|uniref:Alpha/Beta hydrolase protein n=1 Tax=Podospora didyma TaxID=330526 RepID=A0AAE0U8H5_9PEZI|nr:Alpha/Beta hydrolase protein [Podospora didyma]